MDRISVRATDSRFGAKGDGIVNDRAYIQAAIDYVFSAGGGTVLLDAGKVFLSSGIVLKDNVNLHFEDGAEIYQTPDPDGYVKPCGDGYVSYTPVFGQNFSDEIKWSHNWYHNYPFIFAPEESYGFSVTGKGIIRMMTVTDTDRIIKICPIGFYRCSNFVISDVHITNYHGYAMMPFTCNGGLIKDVVIDKWGYGNGDGICLMNSKNIRVTGCRMFTGDDSLYIFSSYRDPRKGEWWSSDEPQASENIEVDHNDLVSNHCKAFGMILWGCDCPDQEKIEVRNVYVHDNHFETLGNWNWNPYSDRPVSPPVTTFRFENNVIDGIECNFFETKISDMNHFHSIDAMQNCGFEQGRSFWALRQNETGCSAGAVRGSGSEPGYGFICDYDKGDTAIYQGIYITAGHLCMFDSELRGKGRIFVRNLETGETVVTADFDNAEFTETPVEFRVSQDGNYHIGIENGAFTQGKAEIRNVRYSASASGSGCESIITDRGKIIYKYNDNLFRREEN